jgi:HNH endonuclease
MTKRIYPRAIYKKFFGDIPKDTNGRSYEIHHIDGNHNNNDINNLKLVTIEEHYAIHYTQGDYGACLIMTKRMGILPEEKSKLASKHSQARIARGDHPFLRKGFQSNTAQKMVEKGTHPFLGGNVQRESNRKRKETGTHHLLGNSLAKDSIDRGTHTSVVEWSCFHCGKVGKGGTNYSRWHGDNCHVLKVTK